MQFQFKILDPSEIFQIIPLVQKLSQSDTSEALLKERFAEMLDQDYECAVIYDRGLLIGMCGLWYRTRHYAGKTLELDHVYIDADYRRHGLGKKFMTWIYDHAKSKACITVELNTFVQNYPSHKFYYNEGFEILGYHFLKTI